jgi:lipopolysaccharide export system protein LptA
MSRRRRSAAPPAPVVLAPVVLALVVLALVSAAPRAPAWAQAIDLSRGGPVEVTARDGFEWRDADQEVIATGDARAVRDNVTVLADRLVAHFRKKADPQGAGSQGGVAQGSAALGGAQPDAARSTAVTTGTADLDNGSTEIYRLDAIGHVRIVTPTDEAVGDKAVYDIDKAVLVMTGHGLKLTTPQYVLTARDSLEYWSQEHMAVGRGNAVVVATDGRRLSGDVLVAYLKNEPAGSGGGQPAAAQAAARPAPGASAESAGKLDRVEAFGNVEVRTQADIVRGERGIYVPETGVARVLGNVRITHGQNQMAGAAADVNMKTGIAHVISDPGKRVQGLIIPNDAQGQGAGQGAPGTPPRPPGNPAGPRR